MSAMDGLIQRQLNRIYRRECHQLGRHLSQYKTHSKPQINRIHCESDDILSYALDEKSLPGLYVAAKPLEPDFNEYFEIEVLECSSLADIALGLVSNNHPMDQMPGYVANSVGYHAGDGRIYLGHQRGTVVADKCEIGDRIGCGVHFEPMDERTAFTLSEYSKIDSIVPSMKMKVYFTLNGSEISSTVITPLFLRGSPLFPAIALCSPGEEVKLNLNLKWSPSALSRSVSDESLMCIDSYEDDWMRLHDIRLNGNLLEYAGRGKSILDVGLAQARRPLDTQYHYFEIEILDPGESCYIAIGLTRKDYPRHSHPGWNKGSIAYHADDGKIFVGSGAGDPFGPRCHRGDIMGCGIKFPRNYSLSESDKMSKAMKKWSNRSNSSADSEIVNIYSSSDEQFDEQLSESSHSGGENDSSLEEMDGNNDFFHKEKDWKGWMIPLHNDLVPFNPRIQGYRQLPPMAPIAMLPFENYLQRADSVVDESNGGKVEVFFTRNGVIIGQKDVSIPKGGFYPTVGMLSTAEKVKVDLHPLTG
ncbi:SPRY domain-containing protein 3-like [Oppia nitens]|uniref:SPRY domain-containing protein 3-like n=1 Tax=Oppia nitens TaxID=1686743 RepID=UPI0023DC70B7|nr:SPRY domain-containing protein 3-like [Oppia nitens]